MMLFAFGANIGGRGVMGLAGATLSAARPSRARNEARAMAPRPVVFRNSRRVWARASCKCKFMRSCLLSGRLTASVRSVLFATLAQWNWAPLLPTVLRRQTPERVMLRPFPYLTEY